MDGGASAPAAGLPGQEDAPEVGAGAREKGKRVPTMKLTPIGDRVLVKRCEAEEKTAGGIVLPDSAKEKPKQGEVIAVGTGRMTDDGERVPLSVKKGDRVLFTSYAGNEVKVDGEEFLLMREEDILAVVKK
jgi:chaperonin GroES